MILFRFTARCVLAAPLVAALVAVSGCADRSKSLAVDSTRAAITIGLKGPGTRDGVWTGADAHSSWHAILDGPRIAQLDEIALFTDGTRAMRQFQFDSVGVLSKLHEERVQLMYGATAAPDTVHTVIELEWVQDSLTRSTKRVNGTDKMLQLYEIDNLRVHVDELVRAARAGSILNTKTNKSTTAH